MRFTLCAALVLATAAGQASATLTPMFSDTRVFVSHSDPTQWTRDQIGRSGTGDQNTPASDGLGNFALADATGSSGRVDPNTLQLIGTPIATARVHAIPNTPPYSGGLYTGTSAATQISYDFTVPGLGANRDVSVGMAYNMFIDVAGSAAAPIGEYVYARAYLRIWDLSSGLQVFEENLECGGPCGHEENEDKTSTLSLLTDHTYRVFMFARALAYNVQVSGGNNSQTYWATDVGSSQAVVDPYFFLDPNDPANAGLSIRVSEFAGNTLMPMNNVPEPPVWTLVALIGLALPARRLARLVRA